VPLKRHDDQRRAAFNPLLSRLSRVSQRIVKSSANDKTAIRCLKFTASSPKQWPGQLMGEISRIVSLHPDICDLRQHVQDDCDHKSKIFAIPSPRVLRPQIQDDCDHKSKITLLREHCDHQHWIAHLTTTFVAVTKCMTNSIQISPVMRPSLWFSIRGVVSTSITIWG
jgi:hypothetical protein